LDFAHDESPRSVVIKKGIIRTASNIDKTADHFSEDIYWLWLFGCDRPKDTSSKQEAVTVSIHIYLKVAGCGAILFFLLFLVSTHSRLKAAGASLKSLAPSGFAALISLSSQEKREREYNTALSVTPAFAIS